MPSIDTIKQTSGIAIINASSFDEETQFDTTCARQELRMRIAGLLACSALLLGEMCDVVEIEPWIGCLLGLCFAVVSMRTKTLPRIQPLDICAAFLSLFAVWSVYHSVHPAISETPALRVTVLVLFYAVLRTAGRSINQPLFWVLSALAAILSVSYGVVTAARYIRLAHVQVGSLVAFRDQFASVRGETPSAWITIFLALLPFPLLLSNIAGTRVARWTSAAISTSLLVVIGLTFSRGVYVGFAVFLVAVIVGVHRLQYSASTIFRRILAPVLISGLLLLPVSKSVLDTLLLVRSTSQSRSLSGRMVVWKHAKAITASHPLNGSGPGTFAVEYMRRKDPSEPVVFSAFNIVLETLVEQGIVGVFLWTAVLVTLFARLLRIWLDQRAIMEDRVSACFLAASVASVLVRDASYASLSSPAVLAVFFLVLAVAANLRTYETETH